MWQLSNVSDVSAVVLTIGESTTERALKSIEQQDYPLSETILVENVTPSYRAGNVGASRVKTDYLVIVGADMVLEPGRPDGLGRVGIRGEFASRYQKDKRDTSYHHVIIFKLYFIHGICHHERHEK